MNLPAKVISIKPPPFLMPKPQAHEDHFAQFYDTVDFLVASLAEYLRIGLEKNEGLLVIATKSVWMALQSELHALDIKAANLIAKKQLVYLDAEKVASLVVTNKGPSRSLFTSLVAPQVEELKVNYSAIRCYGEVVNVLCQQGKVEEAIVLEGYWNDYLSTQDQVTLMCGYSKKDLQKSGQSENFKSICCTHCDTIQTEDIDPAVADISMLKRLGRLEQRALALKFERRQAENRESTLGEVIRGLTNIEKFSSLNEICLLLAHKIRNHLQVIQMTNENLAKKSHTSTEFDKALVQTSTQRIESATTLITELVRNILETLSR